MDQSSIIIYPMADEFSRTPRGGVFDSRNPSDIFDCLVRNWLNKPEKTPDVQNGVSLPMKNC